MIGSPGERQVRNQVLVRDVNEGVRSSDTVFVVLPGHETPEVMDTLLSNKRFSLVEKKGVR
jgi:hypothetical protein